MKAVIVGGGIAGLSLGILLKKNGHEVVVCERADDVPSQGHAFLMHQEGQKILNTLKNGSLVKLPSNKVEAFNLKRPGGADVKYLKLDHWKCIKRADLTRFLYNLFPPGNVRMGRTFSHFLYEGDKVVTAVFDNGDTEHGDIFIGADGSQSKVRQEIMGKVNYSPVTVKEIVGSITMDLGLSTDTPAFTKYQHEKRGLAFGLIPTGNNEYVWFMQYDPTYSDFENNGPASLEAFCREQLGEFPSVVQAVIDANDFTRSYVWNTTDFDLLPKFHHQNVVLIGDAAHLALPFTSTGTTNALVDAKTLSACLANATSIEAAFQRYYRVRANDIGKHITAGRELNEWFRNPSSVNDDEIPVPLIPPKIIVLEKKPVQVLYFTDPVCSTCWVIQPLLRKLYLEYGKYLDIKYCMGGLLPSWEGYDRGQIRKPSDAARHWEEVCQLYDTPLDGDVWFEDPLSSSYPPSIAFKAAQMQDTDKAILFLRRIKEMLFLEKKNIIKWEFLEKAAFETGLDAARLKRDFEGKAPGLFKADLELATDLGIKVFPTLIFSDGNSRLLRVAGYHDYDKFENIVLRLLPNAVKQAIPDNPVQLFKTFYSMTEKEFSVLTGASAEDSRLRLQSLERKGLIGKQESKNGTIWIKKEPQD